MLGPEELKEKLRPLREPEARLRPLLRSNSSSSRKNAT